MKKIIIIFSLLFLNTSIFASQLYEKNIISADRMMTSSATPPGLTNKPLPEGLSNQNKTPPGWSHGKKKGWSKTHSKYWYKHHPQYKHHPHHVIHLDD